MSQVTIELPYVFSQSVMYCIIVYAMMGYEWCFAKVLWFFFFMFFTFLYFTYYGIMVIAATPSYHVALIISTAFYGMWNLFCGFIVPRTVSTLICPRNCCYITPKFSLKSSWLYSGFLCGGDGSIGLVHCHGHCMD